MKRYILSAYIVKEWCQEPSNFRCSGDLDTFFKERNIPGVYGIDTRKLAKTIRESGSMNGWLTEVKPPYDAKKLEEVKNFHITKAVETVTPKKCEIKPADEKEEFQIVLWDSAQRKISSASLTRRGCRVADLPAGTTAEEILKMNPDGIMLSNWSRQPRGQPGRIIEEIRKITKAGKPMFRHLPGTPAAGDCQGAKTGKMKFGHRGANQPVKDLTTGRVYISSQNHGYEVLRDTLAGGRGGDIYQCQRRHLRGHHLPRLCGIYRPVPSRGLCRSEGYGRACLGVSFR